MTFSKTLLGGSVSKPLLRTALLVPHGILEQGLVQRLRLGLGGGSLGQNVSPRLWGPSKYQEGAQREHEEARPHERISVEASFLASNGRPTFQPWVRLTLTPFSSSLKLL